MQSGKPIVFREAKRIQQSFLAALEKRTLLWLAARTPLWINSDHLTLLGLLAMAGARAGYWWASSNRWGLSGVIVCLPLNSLAHSLAGNLPPLRHHPRPPSRFSPVQHVA